MRYLLTLYLMLGWVFSPAQERWSDATVPDKAIMVSPLHLLNFYPTIEVSYAQRIFRRYTASLEFGIPDEFVPPFFPIPNQSNGIRIGPNMGLRLGYRLN